MVAKRKGKINHSEQRSPARRLSTQDFYTPFKGLDQHLARTYRNNSSAGPVRHVSPKDSSAPEAQEESERLFREAMSGVVPLARTRPERVPPAPPAKGPARFLAQEEFEAYAQLVDLVEGEGAFELTYSDEYADGSIVGLSPEILKKLRRGDFSYQDHIDLHGLNRKEAREVVTRFILQSFAAGCRCILIISGRGLNSADKQPVLKKGLVKWLTQAPLKRFVLAFASARSYDGGAGAFYVLLRRNPGKAIFVTRVL